MNKKVMFSSNKDDWETPQSFYNALDREFHFTLDPAASHDNHKCEPYFTKEQDGLKQSWQGHIVFCNPPYGRKVGEWVKKGYEESLKPNTKVVMLLPARTDTKWFHDYIYGKAEIRFIKGRLKFGGCKDAAPFPSMVVIFKRG
jgi:phage N-6-adenine-methyltransferase